MEHKRSARSYRLLISNQPSLLTSVHLKFRWTPTPHICTAAVTIAVVEQLLLDPLPRCAVSNWSSEVIC